MTQSLFRPILHRLRLTVIQLVIGLIFLPIIGNHLLFAKTADRIIAVVGEQIILASEVNEAVEFMKLMTPTLASDSQLVHQILDELIKSRLLLEEAKRETVEVSRQEIEEEVERNIQALKRRFDDDTAYQQALEKEGITERKLRERYRDDIKKRLISQKLLAKKGLTNINITPIEVQNFYHQHKDSIARSPGRVELAHILFMIKPSQSAEQALQNRVSEIYDILLRGGDFEEVAQSFSDDKATKNRGGYLGMVELENLQPEIQVVVKNLKPNEISMPARSRYGYEIFKCLSRRGNKIELRHILIAVNLTKRDTLNTKKTAEQVRALALKGISFDSLAKLYSDDPMTKDSSGYLGEFLLSGLQEPYRTAVAKLKAGEISEPVLSEHGYHLIKVLNKEEERILSLEDLQDEIRNYLFEAKLKERLQEYLTKIANRTYIKKYL
ncbi:MAG: peptidylprolyl isomerase [candidate division WOR-3 bacterium]|nr:peptidylprolyl isomerase [candidate division WOR-3 bacterium]